MIKLLGALLLSLFLAGCNQKPPSDNSDAELLIKIVDLQIKLGGVESQLEGIQEQLALANQRIALLEAETNYSSALLTPGDSTYRTVKTDLGPVLVSLADVQPYANGSQVRIWFGNTTSVNIHAPKAMFRWGSKPKGQALDYTKGKSRTIVFDASEASVLRAGKWTSATFKLDGVPPSELDYITVEQIDWASVTL